MEKISELMDGEMDSREASVYLRRMKEESKLREDWRLYHLVGEAIRREGSLAVDISKAVGERLALEPTVMAPRFTAPRRALNRYVMTAAAGVAGIAVVGWVAFHGGQLYSVPTPASAPVIASASAPAAQPTPVVAQPARLSDSMPSQMMAQDAEVEDYLMAHRAVSPFTTMHGALPYVRAAADGHSE